MTSEGLATLQRELDHMVSVRRPEIAARIKEARELGDLKENAEYHAAKDEQSFLETRVLQVEEQLRTARVVDGAGSDRVTVGSTVLVRDLDDGTEESWTITGVAEADPLEQRISYESPIGSALMDRRAGDSVDVQLPRGGMRLEIKRIS